MLVKTAQVSVELADFFLDAEENRLISLFLHHVGFAYVHS